MMTERAAAWSQLALVLGLDEATALEVANAADSREPGDASQSGAETPAGVAPSPADVLLGHLETSRLLVRLARDAPPSHIALAFESTAPVQASGAELVLRDGLGCDENVLYAVRQLALLGLDVLVDDADEHVHTLVVVPRNRLGAITSTLAAVATVTDAPPPPTHAPPAGGYPARRPAPNLRRFISVAIARYGEAHPAIHERSRPVMSDGYLLRTRDGRSFAVGDDGIDAWISLALALGLDDAAARDVGLAYVDPGVYFGTHRSRLAAAFPGVTAPDGVTPLLALFDRLHLAGLAVGLRRDAPAAHIAGALGALRPVYGAGVRFDLGSARSPDAALRMAGRRLTEAGLELVAITMDPGAHQLAVVPTDRLAHLLRASLDAHPFVAPVPRGAVLRTTVPVVRLLDFTADDGVDETPPVRAHGSGHSTGAQGQRFSGAWAQFDQQNGPPSPPLQPERAQDAAREPLHGPGRPPAAPDGANGLHAGHDPATGDRAVAQTEGVRDDPLPLGPNERERPAGSAQQRARPTDGRDAWSALALALGLPSDVADEIGDSFARPELYFEAHRERLRWQFGSIDEVAKLTPVLALCDALQVAGLHAGVDPRFAAADVESALEHTASLRSASVDLRLPEGWANDDALLLAAARLTRWGLELLLVTITPDGYEFAIVPRARSAEALEAAAVVRSFSPDASRSQLPVVRYVDYVG